MPHPCPAVCTMHISAPVFSAPGFLHRTLIAISAPAIAMVAWPAPRNWLHDAALRLIASCRMPRSASALPPPDFSPRRHLRLFTAPHYAVAPAPRGSSAPALRCCHWSLTASPLLPPTPSAIVTASRRDVLNASSAALLLAGLASGDAAQATDDFTTTPSGLKYYDIK